MGTTGLACKISFLKSHSFDIVLDIRVTTNMIMSIISGVASPYRPRGPS
jgi:hypothetical protein